MNDREKARDLGNQSAALARSIAAVLNDTLDALEAAEVEVARLREALRWYDENDPEDLRVTVRVGPPGEPVPARMGAVARAALTEGCNHALIAGTSRCIKCGAALATPTKEDTDE